MKSVKQSRANGAAFRFGSAKRRLAAAMMMGALAALPVTAHATVITKTVNIGVPNSLDGVYINVVTGATSSTEFAGFDINPYNNNTGLTFYTPDEGGTVTSDTMYGSRYFALDLPAGSVIGASSTFHTSQVLGDDARDTGIHFIGFRFLNEATGLTNYGYFNIRTTATTGFPATVTGWSYENGGASITVVGPASGAVPEPATWAMMILGLGAIGSAMRRRDRGMSVRAVAERRWELGGPAGRR